MSLFNWQSPAVTPSFNVAVCIERVVIETGENAISDVESYIWQLRTFEQHIQPALRRQVKDGDQHSFCTNHKTSIDL